MSDLRDLYQEVIIDHGRRPRNFGELKPADREADGFNPLCGDKLHLALTLDRDIVTDVKFTGSGCAISMASASLMTETLKGKPVSEAERLFDEFTAMVTVEEGARERAAELGKLGVLAGVREYPARVKCATLAWHTLDAALKDVGEASTE